MRFAGLILALGVLAGCATSRHALTYPQDWPDADVVVGTHRYQAWFHTHDPTLLLERGDPASLAHMLAQNMTLYAGDQTEPEAVWRAAANALLQPMGCQATKIVGSGQMREVDYQCPADVNVLGEVALRRVEWQNGVRVDDPTDVSN